MKTDSPDYDRKPTKNQGNSCEKNQKQKKERRDENGNKISSRWRAVSSSPTS